MPLSLEQRQELDLIRQIPTGQKSAGKTALLNHNSAGRFAFTPECLGGRAQPSLR